MDLTSLDISLPVFGSTNFPSDFDLVAHINGCPKLSSLVVTDSNLLSDEVVCRIHANILAQLAKITLVAENPHFSGKAIQHLTKHCTNLKDIKFEVPIPMVEIEDIIQLIEANNLLEIVELDFLGYEIPEDFLNYDRTDIYMTKLLSTITTHCKILKELILDNFECIKISQLASILQNCPLLTKLYAKPAMDYLSFRYSTTETTLPGGKMVYINDYETDNMLTGGDELLAFFSQVVDLRVIYLHGVHVITHEVICAIADNNANTLSTLSFDECRRTFTAESLKYLFTHCQILHFIDLKHVIVSAAALMHLFDTPNTITKFITSVCDAAAMKHILIANPQIESVTVHDCHHKKQEELKSVLLESGLNRVKLSWSETDYHRFH